MGRRVALGGPLSGPADPSDRPGNREGSSHHLVQSLRHRRHVGRRGVVARYLGGRRGRRAASGRSNRRGAGTTRDAARSRRVRTGVGWRRSILLWGREERESQSRPPAITGVTATAYRLPELVIGYLKPRGEPEGLGEMRMGNPSRAALAAIVLLIASRQAAGQGSAPRAARAASATTSRFVLDGDRARDTISRHIYGQFAEHL